MELSTSVQSKNTQNSNSSRSGGTDQGRKEALHSSVVKAVGSSAEALTHSTCGNLRTEVITCILTAAVTVENCALERFPKSFSQYFNSINAEFLLHVVAHFESNDLAVKTVKNRRYIQLSVRARHLGYIRKQFAKRRRSGKIALYQVFSVLCCGAEAEKSRFIRFSLSCVSVSAFVRPCGLRRL